MMRMRFAVVTTAFALMMPALAEAQTAMAKAQVSDLETMQEKFTGLAEAFPESSYDWRPMEGVRSVKQVMALTAAECNLFPRYLGMEGARGAAENFNGEMERLMAMSRSDLIAEMNRGFEHFIAQVEGLSEAQRSEPMTFFGQETTREAAITLAANDMHEHLGQAIAYARTNEIVPPWSRGDGN